MPRKKGQEQRESAREKKKETEDILQLARRKSIAAFLRIVEVAEDEKPDNWPAEETWIPLRVRSLRDYLLANNLIIERAHGKPAQALELSTPEGKAVRCVVSDKPMSEKEWASKYASGLATTAGAAKSSR